MHTPSCSGRRMALTCAACSFHARSDGTCKNKDCAQYSAPRTGEHWKLKQLRMAMEELGEVAREDGTCNNKDCAGYSAPGSGEHSKLKRLRMEELGEVAREDGTCNNKDCAGYSPPGSGEHWKLKRLRREELGEVAREDGTCNNKDCAGYSAPGSGEHSKLERLRRELGEVADRFGDFVHGACVASLSHRHDVRMGIASGMLLRGRIASAAVRLEVLCVAYLCYWKWRAAGFLQRLLHREDEFLRADAQGRACLYERAWAEAAAALPVADFAVVCRRGRGTAELWPRARVQALGGPAGHYYCYSVGGHPCTRNRWEDFQFALLMQDLRSGRLDSALANVAATFAASGATYSACQEHLLSVRLWEKKAPRSRLNFLCWLFKAEGVTAKICEEDWALLAGKARGLMPSLAVAACAVVRRHVWPAPGAPSYGLDDLACFLSLSQSREAVGSKILPPPAAPVAVAVDLGDVGSSCAQVPRKGLRLKSAADAGESRQPPAAGSSCAGSGAASSGACPPARPARRRTGPLLAQVRVITPWVQVLARDDTHILQIIMDELPFRDQVALCRTSNNQRAKCIWTARRWGLARWNEARILMSRTLRQDQPIWEECSANASGVALGCFFRSLRRAESSAWAITQLLKTGPLPADTELLALGLARWGLKLEFVEAGLRALSRDLGAGGRLHMPGVDAVEEWIEEAARRQ